MREPPEARCTPASTFLPTTRQEMAQRGWSELDVLLLTGDAYVDHPSFGVAVIGRLLESRGYRVGIIAQPDWRSPEGFLTLGRPRLFVGISGGNVDSMVANYTAAGARRRSDAYSPGDRPGLRPDRALIVYANRAREAFGGIPIVLGGLEASLRRLAHYDYWEDGVRRSVLLDAKADILVYGMGEAAVLEIASRLSGAGGAQALAGIRGTVTARRAEAQLPEGSLLLSSFEEVRGSPERFGEAFRLLYGQMNPFDAATLVQPHGERWVLQHPPAFPLTSEELDRLHELPYTGEAHPRYQAQGGVRAVETVRFSLVSHRGCCGECSFCSLFMHQGRVVVSRSADSLLREARALSERREFRGTITDIGGPTANMYMASCLRWEKSGFCSERRCLAPEPCGSLRLGYAESLAVYRRIRELPRVRHLFIASGFRHDLLLGAEAQGYLREVLERHISGQMKVAPEHTVDEVLRLMGKPPRAAYERFLGLLERMNRSLGRKAYLVNYFISAHPGSRLEDALALALYLDRRGMRPEQVQDYLPLPLTISGCIYHTGAHPLTGERVFVPKGARERRLQRALLQPWLPVNRRALQEALARLGAGHLLRRLSAPRRAGRRPDPKAGLVGSGRRRP
jgi:uncharacterized radical SAM protein YgiQ